MECECHFNDFMVVKDTILQDRTHYMYPEIMSTTCENDEMNRFIDYEQFCALNGVNRWFFSRDPKMICFVDKDKKSKTQCICTYINLKLISEDTKLIFENHRF